jgi:hypothetical protein
MAKKIPKKLYQPMRNIAEMVSDALPENYGFTLLVFEIGDKDGTMNYMSNAHRQDMIRALEELIRNLKADERH